jgi:hypothetical protein
MLARPTSSLTPPCPPLRLSKNDDGGRAFILLTFLMFTVNIALSYLVGYPITGIVQPKKPLQN